LFESQLLSWYAKKRLVSVPGTVNTASAVLKIPDTCTSPLNTPDAIPVSVSVAEIPGNGSELDQAKMVMVSGDPGFPLAPQVAPAACLESSTVTAIVSLQSYRLVRSTDSVAHRHPAAVSPAPMPILSQAAVVSGVGCVSSHSKTTSSTVRPRSPSFPSAACS